jgi:putative alpha-1,2-mannosidase
MFFYGMFSSSNFTYNTATGDNNVLRPYCDFTLDTNKTLELKLATSFLSVYQAKHNLELEILNDHLNFDSLHKKATSI